MADEQENERRKIDLTDDDLERIAKRAAELVTENVYIEVGKGSIRAFILVVGSALVAIAAWFGILPKFFDK